MKRLLALALIAVTGAFAAGCGGSTNTYWYCWDSGAKAPHHLGHYTAGDHVCSDGELDGTGVEPR
jgi:hypothetical protein